MTESEQRNLLGKRKIFIFMLLKVISRPGQSQGLLYKHLCHKLINWLIGWLSTPSVKIIFPAPSRPIGLKWCFQSLNKLYNIVYWYFVRNSKSWRASKSLYGFKSYGWMGGFCQLLELHQKGSACIYFPPISVNMKIRQKSVKIERRRTTPQGWQSETLVCRSSQ